MSEQIQLILWDFFYSIFYCNNLSFFGWSYQNQTVSSKGWELFLKCMSEKKESEFWG